MTPQNVAAMFAEDRTEWAALCALLDAHPEGALHDPESPEWTARDVYTHLARMMETTTNVMEAKLAGHTIPDWGNGSDEIENKTNARIQEQYSHLSLEEARAWAQEQFERRIRVIESVPADGWDDQMDELARADGGEHYRGHRSYIRTGP
jgi:hypothetical protein